VKVIDIFDALFIIGIGLLFYRFLKKTEAIKILLGIIVFLGIYLITSWAGLERSSFLLKKVSDVMLIGFIIIFHPEIRVVLKKMGSWMNIRKSEKKEVIDEIERAVFSMSKAKTGALIILDTQSALGNQIGSTGFIDAVCSSNLLQTIFHPNTPLHDGAVIIQKERITYAGYKLPLTGEYIPGLENVGTRHLAAREAVDLFGVTAVVVSEQTGIISVVNGTGNYKVTTPGMFHSLFADAAETKKSKNFKKFF
jgi:diadenylate cyclase